jgi:hypothetical protein
LIQYCPKVLLSTTRYETMTPPSDSKFYPSDCFCLKREVQSNVLVECQSCIEGFGKWNDGRGCSCEYHKVNQLHCPICAADRDRLDEMHFEFDNLLLKLSSTVKSYGSCNDDIHEIVELSKRMRHCNRCLLARTISPEFHDEDDITSVADVEETNKELRELEIERGENGEMLRPTCEATKMEDYDEEEAREGAIQEHIDSMTD